MGVPTLLVAGPVPAAANTAMYTLTCPIKKIGEEDGNSLIESGYFWSGHAVKASSMIIAGGLKYDLTAVLLPSKISTSTLFGIGAVNKLLHGYAPDMTLKLLGDTKNTTLPVAMSAGSIEAFDGMLQSAVKSGITLDLVKAGGRGSMCGAVGIMVFLSPVARELSQLSSDKWSAGTELIMHGYANAVAIIGNSAEAAEGEL